MIASGIKCAALMAVALMLGCGSLQGPVDANLQEMHPAVAIAEGFVGTPYRYGGDTPDGFDCSGLVYYSFNKAGLDAPRTTGELFRRSLPVDRWDLRSGDLLFFVIDSGVDHVGLYVGNYRFIHAPSSGKRVSYGSLSNAYWQERLVRAGRL